MSLAPANRRWPKPLRIIRARPRLFVCALIGVIVGLVLPASWRPVTRGLIGWNAGIWLYLAAAGQMILRSEHKDIHRRAVLQDEGRNVILTLRRWLRRPLCAIFAQLASIRDLPFNIKSLHILLALLTILGSWLFVHLTFALHYAHEFFRGFQTRYRGQMVRRHIFSRRGLPGLHRFPVFFLCYRRGLRHRRRQYHRPAPAPAGAGPLRVGVFLQQRRAGHVDQHRRRVRRRISSSLTPRRWRSCRQSAGRHNPRRSSRIPWRCPRRAASSAFSPSMNTGAAGVSPVPGREMPMSACLLFAGTVDDAAHHRDVERLDARDSASSTPASNSRISLWISRASSWNTVEVVRPQPGQAATSGTNVRKPMVCRISCADLDFQRAVAAGLGRERDADGVADALLQQHRRARRTRRRCPSSPCPASVRPRWRA